MDYLHKKLDSIANQISTIKAKPQVWSRKRNKSEIIESRNVSHDSSLARVFDEIAGIKDIVQVKRFH